MRRKVAAASGNYEFRTEFSALVHAKEAMPYSILLVNGPTKQAADLLLQTAMRCRQIEKPDVIESTDIE